MSRFALYIELSSLDPTIDTIYKIKRSMQFLFVISCWVAEDNYRAKPQFLTFYITKTSVDVPSHTKQFWWTKSSLNWLKNVAFALVLLNSASFFEQLRFGSKWVQYLKFKFESFTKPSTLNLKTSSYCCHLPPFWNCSCYC